MLDRTCGFAYDDDDRGMLERWFEHTEPFDREIVLPFAPESPASGIGDTGAHHVAWYRIPISQTDLDTAGYGATGDALLLHFGAVDYAADVWVDGHHVGHHEGGQSPFTLPIDHALDPAAEAHVIVVRAHDDPLDVTVPRGKQDWQSHPHAIWYHRTTGIWRSVWLEAVPALHIESIGWIPDPRAGAVRLECDLSARPTEPAHLRVEVYRDGDLLAEQTISTRERLTAMTIEIPALRNGQGTGELLWSSESPTLLDATLTLQDADGTCDTVHSYLGLRAIETARGRFLVNGRPTVLRSVLEQGYWPASHYTPPDVGAIREEVELIASLGFNAARIHQKSEDPRFLYWCDRLGIMIWGETASAYEFAPEAVRRLTHEWLELVKRDRSHPCIVTWVPFNESWGVHHIAHDAAQQHFTRGIVHLTKALDPSRPVISNDGWEHTDSDIWTIHDYEGRGEVLKARYHDPNEIDRILDGFGPAGRRISVDGGRGRGSHPVMLTEFGGISFASGPAPDDAWGYSGADSAEDFRKRLSAVVGAVRDSPYLAGFCYTQLTDTRQEINGICDEDRSPKLPAAEVARIVRGE